MKKYKKQKNFWSRLDKIEREKYFDILDVNRITDNKAFWKNIQSLFYETSKFANKITLEDVQENITSDDALL